MSQMSTLDVHFTVIVIPVLHNLLSAFCESGSLLPCDFWYWVFVRLFLLVLGGVCIILRGVILGFLLGYSGVEMECLFYWAFCSVNGH
jgi:hypothetical protein